MFRFLVSLSILCVTIEGFLFTTHHLLQSRWANGKFAEIRDGSDNRTENIQFIKAFGDKSVYLDALSGKVVKRCGPDITEIIPTPGPIFDLDFDPITETLLAAYYCPINHLFSLARFDSSQKNWKNIGCRHVIPIKHCFLRQDGLGSISISTNGIIGFQNIDHSIGFYDLPFCLHNCQYVDNKLIFDDVDGIHVFDVSHRKFEDWIPLSLGEGEQVCSFHVHNMPFTDNWDIIFATTRGSVFSLIFSRSEKKILSLDTFFYEKLDGVVSIYADNYKFVIAAGDGSLRIGPISDPKRSRAIYGAFNPREMKRMSVSHRFLFCDSSPGGFLYRDWFPAV